MIIQDVPIAIIAPFGDFPKYVAGKVYLSGHHTVILRPPRFPIYGFLTRANLSAASGLVLFRLVRGCVRVYHCSI